MINKRAGKLMNMKSVLVLLFLTPFIVAEAGERKAFELPKVKVIPIQESASKRQYELYIKLPENYSEDSDKTYPVIYFTDAVWHVELLSASSEYIMEDVILVGISWQKDIAKDLKNDVGEHVSRYRDYTVIESSKPEHQAKYQFGQASSHLEFIRKDVIPYVENHYRTDPSERSYFGYSAGGLFGSYILLSQPDTFKNYILGSPSVQRDIDYLTELNSKAEVRKKRLDANVFISSGTLEADLSEHIDDYIALVKDRNSDSLSLKRVVLEGSHQTAFPITGVRGVTWLASVSDKSK